MDESRRVTVVVPTWNGLHLLRSCVDAVRAQRLLPDEVVVVDNGSTDGTGAWLQETKADLPSLQTVSLTTNRGVAAAFNVGIAAASGAYVALLNNDVVPDPDWLRELVYTMANDPALGSCASKILFARDRRTINSAGDVYRSDGVPGNRGVWEEDVGQYDVSDYVFGASGGAALYRRRALLDVGPFDERFVSYCEDVDWAFRAQLAGYRCRYVPTARVYHVGSATGGGSYASYYCGRNFIATAIKNLPREVWIRHWLPIVRAQMRFAIHSIWHVQEPAARARLRGQLAALRDLPTWLAARERVQSTSRVSADYIERLLAAA